MEDMAILRLPAYRRHKTLLYDRKVTYCISRGKERAGPERLYRASARRAESAATA
ncbi:hypothetical protein RHECNPAF_850011 [Rhizobium etli CNPAF512]|nr:hypothetical protein RHECNPAF_850011 [Rhizobium etli CNPAF512]